MEVDITTVENVSLEKISEESAQNVGEIDKTAEKISPEILPIVKNGPENEHFNSEDVKKKIIEQVEVKN